MGSYAYHSMGDLQRLGEKIRDKAIHVTMTQDDSYGQAQQQANNDATRYHTGQQTQAPGYVPPSSGRPDDHGNLEAYLNQAYAGIPRLFTQFAIPNPDGARPSLDALYQAAVTVAPSLEIKKDGNKLTTPLQVGDGAGTVPVKQTVDTVVTHMKRWEGGAADGFELYVKGLETSAAYQREIALSLANALEVQISIRKTMLADIWEIGDKTYRALDDLDGWCSNSAKVQAKLTILGAIAAVAFVATDGVAAVAVEGLQSFAAIMGAVPALTTQETIGGATVPPILEGMANAITKLNQGVDSQQNEVSQALQKVNQSLDRLWGQALLPAPANLTKLRGAGRGQLEQPDGFYAT